MSTRLETWTPLGQLIKRRGHSPISSRTSLIIGVDEPTALTTGTLPGITLATVSGNVTLSTPGEVYENKDVFGRISVTAANVTIRNCKVRGTASTNTALINCNNAAVVNCLIEDCEIVPDYLDASWSGITGHDFTARRCNIYHAVDAISVFNTAAAQPYQTNVVIEQCYLHDFAWFTAATPGIVHPTDTETHNDLIQHQGGTGSIIRGNRLDASFARQTAHWMVTDPNTEPYTTVALGSLPDGGPYQNIPDVGSGTVATGRYNWDDCAALMINGNVGYTADLQVLDNWIRGGNFAVNGGGNVNPGGGVNLGQFYRNRFSRDQGNQGSGGDTTQTLNFQGGSWAGFVDAPTTGADKNYYIDTNAAVTVRV